MSKPVVFSLLAMACYAVANVILEQRFATRFNNLTVMCFYAIPIFLVGFVGRQLVKTADPSFDLPAGSDLAIMIAMGFAFAAADYFYVGAFTNGGSLLTVTSLMVMFPVFASLIKFVWTQSLPNMWQVSGYVLAVAATMLVAKGSSA